MALIMSFVETIAVAPIIDLAVTVYYFTRDFSETHIAIATIEPLGKLC